MDDTQLVDGLQLQSDHNRTQTKPITIPVVLPRSSEHSHAFSEMLLPPWRSMEPKVRNPEDNCCQECHRMLESCLLRDEAAGNRTIHVRDLDIMALEISAGECPLCATLLSILQGRDGVALIMTKIYEDEPSQQIDLSYKKWHSHADDSMSHSKEMSLMLKVWAPKPSDVTNVSGIYRELRVQFLISLHERALGKRQDIVINEKLNVFRLTDGDVTSHGLRTGDQQHQNILEKRCSRDLVNLMADERLESRQKIALIKDWLEKDLMATASPFGLTSSTGLRSSADFALPNVKMVLPARLLDLSVDGIVRLKEIYREDYTEVPPYAALSHRWGLSQHLKTTRENRTLLRDIGVQLDGLPLTFKDAVTAARLLGLDLLWIDALCIIQDHEGDWLKESSKMGDIFRNAVVTMAVHSARDDSEGFLSAALAKREAHAVRVAGNSVGLCRPPDADVDITNSGLSRRGWVLQERFLASRTLHFTPAMVYFETSTGIQCEDGSILRDSAAKTPLDLEPTKARGSFLSPSALPELRSLLSATRIGQSRPTSLEWLTLVEMYSRCGLTKGTDKLIAISGMASKVFSATGVSWCAGIWGDHICAGLLWLPTNDGLMKPTTQRAPSWSWAAWDGPIQYPICTREPMFEGWEDRFISRCKFVSLTTANREPTQWLNESGFLTVRGRLITLHNTGLYEQRQLGPGPARGDSVSSDNYFLPRFSLKDYVRVYEIADLTGMIGWTTLDSSDPTHFQSYSIDTEAPISDTSEIPTHNRSFLVLATYVKSYFGGSTFSHDILRERVSVLGIYLGTLRPDDPVYRRIGFSQLSSIYLDQRFGQEKIQNEGRPWSEWFFSDDKLTDVTIA